MSIRGRCAPIREIAVKEMREGIVGRKVLSGALFFGMLLLTCALVRVANHRETIRDYHDRVSAQESFLRRYAHYRRLSAVARPIIPPAGMEPMVEAVVRDRDLLAEESFDENPLHEFYPRFDFLFLMATVGSLLALLMSHDAITSERESGTLPLLVSHTTARREILLGKWLGGVLSVGGYLFLALLAAVSVIVVSTEWSWSGSEWAGAGLLFAVCWLYLAVFFSLGLMISALSRSSSAAALGCLAAWVFLCLVLPNLGPFVANTLLAPPPVYEVEKRIDQVIKVEREAALREAREGYLRRGLSEVEAWSDGRLDSINRAYFDRAQAMRDDLAARVARQTAVARGVSCLAPYACFLYAGTEISGVGLSRQQTLSRLLATWRRQAGDYISARLAVLQKSPGFGYDDWIDVSDGPRFRYAEPPVALRLELAAPFIGLLGGFLSAFTLGALLVFSRSRVV